MIFLLDSLKSKGPMENKRWKLACLVIVQIHWPKIIILEPVKNQAI